MKELVIKRNGSYIKNDQQLIIFKGYGYHVDEDKEAVVKEGNFYKFNKELITEEEFSKEDSEILYSIIVLGISDIKAAKALLKMFTERMFGFYYDNVTIDVQLEVNF